MVFLALLGPIGRGTRLRVLEERVLTRIFAPKRDEVTGKLRKLHNELSGLYSSPNSFRVIKSRRMRGTVHVACMSREEKCK